MSVQQAPTGRVYTVALSFLPITIFSLKFVSFLFLLSMMTQEDVIQGLRAASKALPKHQARSGTKRAAVHIQASPLRARSPATDDASHLVNAAMLLQQVAAGNASPRTPVSARHPAGGAGAGMLGEEDDDMERAHQVHRICWNLWGWGWGTVAIVLVGVGCSNLTWWSWGWHAGQGGDIG
jgi:hypothetical protein